jgi:hypothetical protein
MLKLEQIQKNAVISGIEPGQVVRIVTTKPVSANVLTVTTKSWTGSCASGCCFARTRPSCLSRIRAETGHSKSVAAWSSIEQASADAGIVGSQAQLDI